MFFRFGDEEAAEGLLELNFRKERNENVSNTQEASEGCVINKIPRLHYRQAMVVALRTSVLAVLRCNATLLDKTLCSFFFF